MFQGDPCPCDWAYDLISETVRLCECCGRRLEKQRGYWLQITPKDEVRCTGLCEGKRQKSKSFVQEQQARIRYD